MSTHGFLWPYSISGLIRKYIDSITALMTSEQRRGGKKGQHIFENVNLNNVFWVCWKKAIIKCHLAPVACSPLPFPPHTNGSSYNIWDIHSDFSLCQHVNYSQSMCLYFVVCYDYIAYNGSHYFFSITCPQLAFRSLPNDLKVMTFLRLSVGMYHTLLFQHKLLYKEISLSVLKHWTKLSNLFLLKLHAHHTGLS